MRDLIDMWGNTRMVVLTAMTASLYAAILIPFKVLPIIPGVTELRPANAVPVICSFLFGPAGAWGAAIGNVIGDFFGGIGPGDLFGFLGNLLYGLLPYRLWAAIMGAQDPVPQTPRQWLVLVAVIGLASAACALAVGWGINLLGFVPFSLLANIILLNNFVMAVILTPFLLRVIYPRVKNARLHYTDLMAPQPQRPRLVRSIGLIVVVTSVVGGMILGNLLSIGQVLPPFMSETSAATTRAAEVGWGLAPVMLLLFLGLWLL